MTGFFVAEKQLPNTNMTISKPRDSGSIPKYSIDNNPPPPKTVTVGVTLITVETDTIIQDGRAIKLPVDDEVVYTSVPYETAHGKNGCADWNVIAELLEQEGYLKKHWTIQSVWVPVPDHIADDIF